MNQSQLPGLFDQSKWVVSKQSSSIPPMSSSSQRPTFSSSTKGANNFSLVNFDRDMNTNRITKMTCKKGNHQIRFSFSSSSAKTYPNTWFITCPDCPQEEKKLWIRVTDPQWIADLRHFATSENLSKEQLYIQSIPPPVPSDATWFQKTYPTAVTTPVTTTSFYNEVICVSDEEIQRQYYFQQGTLEWKNARRMLITGSTAAIVFGINPYQTADDFLISLVFGNESRSSAYMEYGSVTEQYARRAFEVEFLKELIKEDVHLYNTAIEQVSESLKPMLDQLHSTAELATRDALSTQLLKGIVASFDISTRPSKIRNLNLHIEVPGLCRSKSHPWLAISPDGIVTYTDPQTGGTKRIPIEIKCPIKPSFYHDLEEFKTCSIPGIPPGVPPYYYLQLQLQLYILQCEYGKFVQFHPDLGVNIRDYALDTPWIENEVLPKLYVWYTTKALPLLIRAASGLTLDEARNELQEEKNVEEVNVQSISMKNMKKRKIVEDDNEDL